MALVTVSVWLTCLISFSGLAQISNWQEPFKSIIGEIARSPDTVLAKLLKDPPDRAASETVKAQYFAALSQVYFSLSYPQQALDHAQKSLSLIDPQTEPWLYHTVKLYESQALDIAGKPNSGLVGANASVIWGELNKDLHLVTSALFVRGILLNSLLDYQGALRDLQRAYDLAPTEGSTLTKGNIASILALVYEYRKESALAIPFFEEAVAYNRKTEDFLELSIALYGLGKANKDLGDLDLSRQQLIESLELARKINDQQGVAYALKELAGLEFSLENYQAARTKLDQALAIFKISQNKYMLLDSYRTMALVALAERNLLLAETYINNAYEFADPDTMPIQKLALDEIRSQLFFEQGNYVDAYQLLNSTVAEKDKQLSQNSTKQLHSLRSQYELDVKERENRILEQKNQLQQKELNMAETKNLQLLLLFAATSVICALLVVLVYRTVQNRAQLIKLANTDGLTGLMNRRRVLEMLQLQLELAQRHQHPLSLAIVDIDWFKNINDTFGHAAGDKVLKRFGRLCQDTFRHTDLVGRIGGEEFLIALPHTAIAEAVDTMTSLSLKTKQLARNLGIDGLRLSISCGVTTCTTDTPLEELMNRCDKALYRAKETGRDKVVLFEP